MRYNVATHFNALAAVQVSGSAVLTAETSSEPHGRLIGGSSSPDRLCAGISRNVPKCAEMNLKRKNKNPGTSQLPMNLGQASGQPRFDLGETASN